MNDESEAVETPPQETYRMPWYQWIGALIFVIAFGIPLVIMTFLAENELKWWWIPVLLVFAVCGYFGVLPHIISAFLVYVILCCIWSLNDDKFRTYAQTSMWRLALMLFVYAAAYVARNGLTIAIPSMF